MRDEDRTQDEWFEEKLIASIVAIIVVAFAGIMAVLFL